MDLGCAEFAVPGNMLEDKLRILESHGMWLELTNDGKKQAEDILKVQPNFNAQIKSVQAYLQHEMNMLSADAGEREAAVHHVEETIELASAVGAQNVVVVITYGEPGASNPREGCIELLRRFGELGEELDVTVSIEPLGRLRTTLLPSAFEVLQLIREIRSEHVRLMIDTMHVHSNGQNPAEIIGELAPEISEIQLRDTDSKPPGQGSIDFDQVLKVVREKFKGLLCLEYRPSSDSHTDFANALEILK
ncbi:MAG: sugar phosphate isomerase/epimerase [Candidatus Hadarchaeota archaeon]|nr:sugar phosphate isomerase/epimerase [Candidatus Hadarchaeota archaeon]